MALSFRQLQIFCAVARCGSTTAAAESISLSQSATSAALNELESQLSTRLFDRVGKRLQLNEVGRRFLPRHCACSTGWRNWSSSSRFPPRPRRA